MSKSGNKNNMPRSVSSFSDESNIPSRNASRRDSINSERSSRRASQRSAPRASQRSQRSSRRYSSDDYSTDDFDGENSDDTMCSWCCHAFLNLILIGSLIAVLAAAGYVGYQNKEAILGLNKQEQVAGGEIVPKDDENTGKDVVEGKVSEIIDEEQTVDNTEKIESIADVVKMAVQKEAKKNAEGKAAWKDWKKTLMPLTTNSVRDFQSALADEKVKTKEQIAELKNDNEDLEKNIQDNPEGKEFKTQQAEEAQKEAAAKEELEQFNNSPAGQLKKAKEEHKTKSEWCKRVFAVVCVIIVLVIGWLLATVYTSLELNPLDNVTVPSTDEYQDTATGQELATNGAGFLVGLLFFVVLIYCVCKPKHEANPIVQKDADLNKWKSDTETLAGQEIDMQILETDLKLVDAKTAWLAALVAEEQSPKDAKDAKKAVVQLEQQKADLEKAKENAVAFATVNADLWIEEAKAVDVEADNEDKEEENEDIELVDFEESKEDEDEAEEIN